MERKDEISIDTLYVNVTIVVSIIKVHHKNDLTRLKIYSLKEKKEQESMFSLPHLTMRSMLGVVH